MSPLDFVHAHATDERLFSGRFFSSEPLEVAPGDRVGVVLLVPGAPEKTEEVLPFLYHRLMLPRGTRSGWKLWLKHFQSQFSARLLSRHIIPEYRSIGGGVAINRLNREQSDELKTRLISPDVLPDGVDVSTYIASPFGTPSMAQAARELQEDGVTHVVLLPLFPQYALETTGKALSMWESLVQKRVLDTRPTLAVYEFSTRSKYLAALNERIEEALQRFPRHIRPEVEILFAAHGIPTEGEANRRDPYMHLVEGTVREIMSLRDHDRSYSLSFVRRRSWGDQVSVDLRERLRRMARAGSRAVVVVPVDYVTEQFDTAFLLDVRMREVAEAAGIPHYQVASGLNCHPLFMDGLTDLVVESLVPAPAQG